MNGRQNIALWTNAVSHLHHEIKAVNIWLVFIRLPNSIKKIEINYFFFID